MAVMFHMRLTRPLLGLILVVMGLSIILRDQNRNVFISAGLCLLLCLALKAETPPFAQRIQFVIDAYAHPKSTGPPGYATIAAKLRLHEDAALCSRRLEELLAAGPTGDMFWMYPVTAIAYLDRGQLSDSARQALRRSFKTYMPYRGDTENHWLLYYTCLYLAAQMWPDLPGDQWYSGKVPARRQHRPPWNEFACITVVDFHGGECGIAAMRAAGD